MKFPSPAQIPARMGDFAQWLATAADTSEATMIANRRLVDIHPFNDGNGRTVRLAMNLIRNQQVAGSIPAGGSILNYT
jgi:Fic family protein